MSGVMDRIYVSDKTDLGWSKIEGQVKFALQKASDMGLPLVVPDSLASYYSNIRDWAGISGFTVKETNSEVTVHPGPAGATYCELKGYTHYEQNAVLAVNSLVLENARPSP